jgi:hypothetical protein
MVNVSSNYKVEHQRSPFTNDKQVFKKNASRIDVKAMFIAQRQKCSFGSQEKFTVFLTYYPKNKNILQITILLVTYDFSLDIDEASVPCSALYSYMES